MVPRILIVEDDTLTRISLATALTRRGCVVAEAPSAATAVRAAKACEPDLILIDVNRPERDGANVLEALRESDPDLPVLLMSRFIATRMERCALRLGAPGRINGAPPAWIVGREIGGWGGRMPGIRRRRGSGRSAGTGWGRRAPARSGWSARPGWPRWDG